MILDAAAGNRTMYQTKTTPNIIYIDIERKLEVKPTIFASNEQTPFHPHFFDTIIYDPPHTVGMAGGIPAYPDKEMQPAEYKGKTEPFTYYGSDKYKTSHALKAHIYRTQKELYRILTDDGLLWLKWNEVRIPLRKILTIFHNWLTLMVIPVTSPLQTAGQQQTYWVCLCKKREITRQLALQ